MKENMSPCLCLLTSNYPYEEGNLRGIFIKRFVLLLVKKGWQVRVVVPLISKKSKPFEDLGAEKIYRFPFLSQEIPLFEYERVPLLRMALYFLSGLLTTIKVIKKEGCLLINGHNLLPSGLIALLAGRLTGLKVAVTGHGTDVFLLPERSFFWKKLISFVVGHADLITSVAEHMDRKMVQLGAERKKIITFPMGVEEEMFNLEAPRSEEVKSAYSIISNRGLDPIYNVELLIRAFPKVAKAFPEAHLLIAGVGKEKESLEALCQQLHIDSKVSFLNWIAHEKMPGYLRACLVYVSTSPLDGASVSLLEAMACGCLPVVSDIEANREWVVDGDNGLLFKANDEEQLAQKILLALQEPAMREKARVKNSQIIREKAQWSQHIAMVDEAFRGLI